MVPSESIERKHQHFHQPPNKKQAPPPLSNQARNESNHAEVVRNDRDRAKGARTESDCAWKKRDNGEGRNKRDRTDGRNERDGSDARNERYRSKGRKEIDCAGGRNEIYSAERGT